MAALLAKALKHVDFPKSWYGCSYSISPGVNTSRGQGVKGPVTQLPVATQSLLFYLKVDPSILSQVCVHVQPRPKI